MRKAGHEDCMGDGRVADGVQVGRPEGKKPLEIPRAWWENNIKKGLQELRWKGANKIALAQDRKRWRAVVNAVMNFRIL
jgi:hypothetical protein